MPAEHRELAAALCARDAEAAAELFAVHRRHAFDVLTGGGTVNPAGSGPGDGVDARDGVQ